HRLRSLIRFAFFPSRCSSGGSEIASLLNGPSMCSSRPHTPMFLIPARPGVCLLIAASFVTTSMSADDRPPQVETLQPGVTLTLVAEHPQLATPTGVDVDS